MGRGRSADDAFVEVVLDDGPEDDAHTVPDPGTSGAVPGLARRRRRLVGAAVVAAVLVATVTVGVVQTRQQAAERAALAGVSGVVDEMPDVPTEVWRVGGESPVAQHDGVLVVQGTSTPIAGYSLETGERVWGTGPGSDPWPSCWAMSAPGGWGLDVPAADRILCERSTGWGSSQETEVAVVLTATGTTVFERTFDGDLLGVESVEGDLVVGRLDDAGRPYVVRIDVGTGTETWRYQADEPLRANDPYGFVARDAYVLSDHERIHLQVDLSSGDAHAGAPAGSLVDEITLRDGRRVVYTQDDDHVSMRLEDASGDVLLELPDGGLLFPAVDDGSRPDLAFTSTPSGLTAHDLTGGGERWSRTGLDAAYPLVLVRGVLVLQGPEGTVALDARNGDTLWSVPRTEGEDDVHGRYIGFGGGALTDGRRVLLQGPPELGRQVLVARSLRDGTQEWAWDMSSQSSIWAAAGLLLVHSPDEGALVAMGGADRD